MTYKVFIDGSEGTTGLKIHDYFSKRSDIELLKIDERKRKNLKGRLDVINQSDVTFLCLPDEAAKEIAPLIDKRVKLLDTSTAHRTNSEWTYGLPELCDEQKQKIAESTRVAVPGCHATGFILLVRPLIEKGILQKDYPFSCTSISGYSGAGKKIIAQYEKLEGKTELEAPRQYATGQSHKHLPEMKKMTGIDFEPVFIPFICNYYSGMEISVPIITRIAGRELSAEKLRCCYKEHYEERTMITVESCETTDFIRANELSGENTLKIRVTGNAERMILSAVYDNLGKGASGAAIQCMNIMLGLKEETGLI